MNAIRRAWRGVIHRTDYWPRFWGEFSLASDPHPSFIPRFVNNFLRAFTILYFFILIRWAVFSNGGHHDPENHGDAFMEWEERFDAMCYVLI